MEWCCLQRSEIFDWWRVLGGTLAADRLPNSHVMHIRPVHTDTYAEATELVVDGQSVMLQAVSIFTKPTEWTIEEMLPIMMDVSNTSLQIIGLIE